MKDQTTNEFMAPIWKITLMTMLGTTGIGFALHIMALELRHKENMQQVKNVEFQGAQITQYHDLYRQQGKDAAAAFLNAK